MKNLKVALVHDYLREYGGAERVLESLHEVFPEAPIFTAYYSPKELGSAAQRMKNWDIRTSWIQDLPLARRLISPFRLLAPAAFESFDLSSFDLVISSCNLYFAKGVITKPGTLHISYIHTPPRYLYGFTTSFNYKKHWWTRVGGELANHFLRLWDFELSQRPDILVANSQNVAKRIEKFYRRQSVVIYPPVDVGTFSNQRKINGGYYLSVSRLVRGKGVDVIVEACTKLGVPLKVAGTGPQLQELKAAAGKTVEFLEQVTDADLPALFAQAQATIVASEDEDFGIVPVESMACGTPVIAVRAGGFLETVVEGKTGEFFDKATPEALMEALQKFDAAKYRAEDCRKQAEEFSKERFKKEILQLIGKHLK